jgi:medium-chain acyl-[acyl-carrier-protein] hydrolase
MYSTAKVNSPNGWLANLEPNPQAKLRLFCFPYAGGAAGIYRNWAVNLPSAVEVCPIHLPGRGKRMREPAFTQVQALVKEIAPALRPYADKPFAFFGHSMGGLISFELARQLRRERAPGPAHLFISGRRAPQIPNLDAPTFDLPEADFLATLRDLKGTPPDALEHPELMQLMMPLLRADFELCETYAYAPEPPLDCPITAYGGLQDGGVTRMYLEAWSQQTTAAFTLRMIPGDHFYLNTAQPLLLRTLSQELTQLANRYAQLNSRAPSMNERARTENNSPPRSNY